MAFSIGGVEIEGRAALAPLAGVTDLPFRVVCREHGCGLTCSEMVSAAALALGGRKAIARARGLMASDRPGAPYAIQLFGSRPEHFAAAAPVAAEAGASLIDINMGCPVRKVVSSGSGAALLLDPARAAAIVAAVVRAVRVPVTVKLRSGFTRGKISAPEVARLCVEAGARGVAVHGRARDEGYSVPADWSVIAAVVQAVPGVPVLGNGDVRSLADAEAMLERTGCAAVLIGRGAMGHPGIFGEIARGAEDADVLAGRAAALARHAELVRAEYGEDPRVAAAFRKHLVAYTRAVAGAAELRRRLMELRTLEAQTEAGLRVLERAREGSGPGPAALAREEGEG